MKGRTPARALVLATVLVYLMQPMAVLAGPTTQVSPETRAQTLLDDLTPEERVGQLFLVDFDGVEVTVNSPIYDLITKHHIGGVVLKAENDNFIGPEDTLTNAWGLIQALQTAEETASQRTSVNPVSEEIFAPAYIPLFISITQDGDGYPQDEILSGLTPIPSQLAIGATWDTGLARQAGEVLGSELSALGFNLLLGPSLDILAPPHPEYAEDLGVRSFGGSPYWVGSMGSAFTAGIHTGSNNQMAVIGKHFPGYSGSVRPLEEDIPTVLKSLEQLKRNELSPFFAVTSLTSAPESRVDGLLVSHSRYTAFQGDVNASTRPISSDPQAFQQLIALPEFADWYDGGGLMISDELGTRAIRRFYDPTEGFFNARFVALNAFLAGNDLLILGDFLGSDAPDEFTTITRTLSFFAQKYREDPAFADRVDNAVLRILTLKFKLYGQFTIGNVLTDEKELPEIGNREEITFNIARKAVTLLSPGPDALGTVFPSSPAQRDIVVIITDSYLERQCSTCPQTGVLPSDYSLASVVNRLYGPTAGGLILSRDLISYSFSELNFALDSQDDEENHVVDTLAVADWIIFVMLDINQARPTSSALQRLLSDRPDLIQDKKTIVFALNAPYYLDATDISKLTAFYGLYSKHPQFIEVAARLLFKEVTAPGASPVSIDGIGYDIAEATTPDPERTFGLVVYTAATGPPSEVEEGTPEAPVDYRVGDTVVIETDPILDYNGHPVPDNTAANISLNTTTAEGGSNPRQINAQTIGGVARTSFILETAGVLEIQVTSGIPAAVSEVVQIDVADAGESGPVVVTGTPAPTNPSEDTPVTTPVVPTDRKDKVNLGDWLLTLAVITFIGVFAYQIGVTSGHVRWGVRWGLSALIGGLLVNTYLSFGFPGVATFIMKYELWGIVIITAVGALLGWLTGFIWRYLKKQ